MRIRNLTFKAEPILSVDPSDVLLINGTRVSDILKFFGAEDLYVETYLGGTAVMYFQYKEYGSNA